MEYQRDLTRFFEQNNRSQHFGHSIYQMFSRGPGKLSYDRKLDPKDPLLFGIELEVEGITATTREAVWTRLGAATALWSVTDDTSLRNNGAEFVSHPLRYSDVQEQIPAIMAALPPKTSFSRRAGIHIHTNVADLKYEQYVAFIVLYSMLEPALFQTVAEHRRRNIYCVGLNRSLSYVDAINVQKGTPTVGKYAALNILPVRQYGTVEFRHFESTGDYKKILSWIDVIADMQRYVRENVRDAECLIAWLDTVLQLRTTSEFIAFMQGALSERSFNFLYGEPTVLEDMEVQINSVLSHIATSMCAERLRVTPFLKNYF